MIIEVPATPPVTNALVRLISATAVLLLVHVPGLVASLNVVEVPGQRFIVPMIPVGKGLTVTTVVFTQPVTGTV